MMMNSKKSDDRPRRALFLLLSGFLAMLIGFGLAQGIAAEDDEPTPLMPDSSSIYKDLMPTEAEIEQIEDPVERYIAMEFISPDLLLGSDLSTSTKEADRAEVPAGSEVQYTIVISNSGDVDANVTMTDTLPVGLSYISHERVEINNGITISPEFSIEGNEIIWKGTLGLEGYAEIAIKAEVDENVPVGTMITNTAQISSTNQVVSPTATITVLEKVVISDVNLPIIAIALPPNPPEVTNVTATRPNSQNQFTLSWTGGPGATYYIVEQTDGCNSPIILHDTGLETSLDLQPAVSWCNDFYFRVRAFEGHAGGKWSDPINVVGAYYDEFNDRDSGWAIRRTTHIDAVKSWYDIRPKDGDDWLILEVFSKWDWGISSSLAKAPEPPYVIEYDGKFADIANEIGMGIVFGGDMIPGELCPDKSSIEGWYQHTACFNHFYNPQYYWAGEALHLIWLRTDKLVWCPDCDGSPMKRIGYVENVGQLKRVDSEGWNRHRIEVRNDSIKYYAAEVGRDMALQYETNDTRFINEQYFGVFAYAGEYTRSVARFEYYSITPLDS